MGARAALKRGSGRAGVPTLFWKRCVGDGAGFEVVKQTLRAPAEMMGTAL